MAHDQEIERRAHPENFCSAHDWTRAENGVELFCMSCGTVKEPEDDTDE